MVNESGLSDLARPVMASRLRFMAAVLAGGTTYSFHETRTPLTTSPISRTERTMRGKLMPAAKMATASLSPDSRPNAIRDASSIAIGNVCVTILGST